MTGLRLRGRQCPESLPAGHPAKAGKRAGHDTRSTRRRGCAAIVPTRERFSGALCRLRLEAEQVRIATKRCDTIEPSHAPSDFGPGRPGIERTLQRLHGGLYQPFDVEEFDPAGERDIVDHFTDRGRVGDDERSSACHRLEQRPAEHERIGQVDVRRRDLQDADVLLRRGTRPMKWVRPRSSVTYPSRCSRQFKEPSAGLP